MPELGAFTSRSDGQTITAALYNADNTQVRDWANTYAVMKDVAATISAIHTYSAAPVFSAGFSATTASTISAKFTLSGTSVRQVFTESDQTTDEKTWDFLVNSKVFTWRTVNDADSSSATILYVTRGTGTAITSLTLAVPTTISAVLTMTAAMTGTSATFSGAVEGATLVGTLTTAAQTNITSLGTLTGLTVNGTATITTISGTTATITTVNATTGNITTVTATNLAGTLTTAAQANVTSLGTLTSLTVSGTATLQGDVAVGSSSADSITIPGTLTGDTPVTTSFRLTNSGGTIVLLSSSASVLSLGESGINVSLGGSTLATNATVGFPLIPTCAGTPTGSAPDRSWIFDSTNKKIYVRAGSTWYGSAALT